MLIVPVWQGETVIVTYKNWRLSGVTTKQRNLLLKRGWPEDMLLDGKWSSFGGLKSKTLSIQTALVKDSGKIRPIAQFVHEDEVHNALLQRNLLIGHGFPTDVGWYRCVEPGQQIDREFLAPSSNKYRLPKPVGWSILKL